MDGRAGGGVVETQQTGQEKLGEEGVRRGVT